MPAVLDTLRHVFGLNDFRPGQKAVVESVLAGRHTVAVMPTGAGKSLCYQLPTIVAGGTGLVVSPLVALMKDQVDGLVARGITAAAITSSLAPHEQAERLAALADGRLQLAYVAPERWRSPRFAHALERIRPHLSLFALDEAHCMSEWGHDFRPDYLRLGEVVARLKPPRLIALTATATPEVRNDIVKQLGMQDPLVLVSGFDRPNLRFTVERVGGAAEKIARLRDLIRASAGATALVYAATRKKAETYADALATSGVRAAAYHAGLEERIRSQVQEGFMSGALQVIVATNAFGMGVDKKDVRLVVHAEIPRSLEAYYQEAGRGGRDGAPADCLLLFQPSDVRVQDFLIGAANPSLVVLRELWRLLRDDPRRGARVEGLRRLLPGQPSEAALASAVRFLLRAGYLRETDGVLEALRPGEGEIVPVPIDAAALEARKAIEHRKLRRMVDYAYAATCRRRILLAYFGDEASTKTDRCGACDACAGTGRRTLELDERRCMQAALRMVERLHGRYGRMRVAGLLCEDDGPLCVRGPRYAQDLLRALEAAGLVVASPGDYPTLSITPAGRSVAAGSESPELALPAPKTSRRARSATRTSIRHKADAALVERLRQFRKREAARDKVSAFRVLSDRVVEAIATARPKDLGALARVPGMGAVSLSKYGAAIVALVDDLE